jgi:hypothetical protein
LLDNLGGYGKMKVIEQIAKDSGAAPKVWKYIAKEAVKTAGTEGLTETAQEAINAAAEQVAGSAKGMLDPENIQRYKESFVKGAIGGGAFGTVGGASQGLTARKEFATAKEAEAYINQLRAQEAAAGTLTPEKAAEYDAQIANDRAQREAGLTTTFADLPDFTQRGENLKALQARSDAMRPEGGYTPEAGVQAEIAKMEAAQAKQAEENRVADAAKAEGSAFARAEPTTGTGGMFKPAV